MEHIKHFLAKFFSSKARTFLVVCFLVLWFIHATALVDTGPIEDRITIVRVIGVIARDIGGLFFSEIIMNPESDDYRSANRQREEEDRILNTEDPERVRILRNYFVSHVRAQRFMAGESFIHNRETIDLRVTPTHIRPGERVRFEAIPSSETPRLAQRILLLSNSLSHSTTLGRWWFGRRYRGSLRFAPEDTGIYGFSIMTSPRWNRTERRRISYISNVVTVVVAPDISQLSSIRLNSPSYFVTQNSMRVVQLTGIGHRDELFDITAPETGTHWTVEDERKATIISEGNHVRLKGLSPGRTRLSARFGHMEAHADVVVIPEPGPPPGPMRRSPRDIRPLPYAPADYAAVRLGDTVRFVASPDVIALGLNPLVELRIVNVTDRRARSQYAALPDHSHTFEWTPTEEGIYAWMMRYVYSMTSENIDASHWSFSRILFVNRYRTPRRDHNILPFTSAPCTSNGGNITVIREAARNIPTKSPPLPPPPPEPQPLEPPKLIKPLDGFVARVGERLHLEATSFDIEGYTFDWSGWRVHIVDPRTDKPGAKIAHLPSGNSERAEWIPQWPGVFEWYVTYVVTGPRASRGRGRLASTPRRILVVE